MLSQWSFTPRKEQFAVVCKRNPTWGRTALPKAYSPQLPGGFGGSCPDLPSPCTHSPVTEKLGAWFQMTGLICFSRLTYAPSFPLTYDPVSQVCFLTREQKAKFCAAARHVQTIPSAENALFTCLHPSCPSYHSSLNLSVSKTFIKAPVPPLCPQSNKVYTPVRCCHPSLGALSAFSSKLVSNL